MAAPLKVADMRVVSGRMDALLDVTIVNAATDTRLRANRSLSGIKKLSAARQAESLKNRKYADLVQLTVDAAASEEQGRIVRRPNGRKFVPFALETNGSLGPSARKFIHILACASDSLGELDKRAFKKLAYASLSVTLQRGNALVLHHQLTDATTRQVLQQESRGRLPSRGGGGGGPVAAGS